MSPKEQVCSFELAKRLKELGIKQDSLFAWLTDYYVEYLPSNIRNEKVCIAAFTVAELGLLLFTKGVFTTQHIGQRWYLDKPGIPVPIEGESEADVRAKMLIYLIKKGLYESGKDKGNS